MRVRGQVGEDLFAKRVWNIQKVVIPLCDAVLTRASPGLCILLQLFDNLQTAAGTRSLVLDFPTQAFRGWSRHHDRPGLRSPPAPRRSVRCHRQGAQTWQLPRRTPGANGAAQTLLPRRTPGANGAAADTSKVHRHCFLAERLWHTGASGAVCSRRSVRCSRGSMETAIPCVA